MTGALLGAGFGIGLWAIAVWLVPPKPSLQQVLASLSGPATAPVNAAARATRSLAATLSRLGLPTDRMQADLALLGRDVDRHLVTKFLCGLACAALAFCAGLALMTSGVAWTTSFIAIAAFAVLGFVLPDLRLREAAQERRSAFRHALGSYLDLVRVLLAGGAGVDSALAAAAKVGSSWTFHQLLQALETSYITRETPWAALEQLGDDLRMRELSDLAASVGLAGTDGAKIRLSIGAKAAALRTKELTDAEGAARAATERMSLPLALFMLGFLVLLGFPALMSVLTGL